MCELPFSGQAVCNVSPCQESSVFHPFGFARALGFPHYLSFLRQWHLLALAWPWDQAPFGVFKPGAVWSLERDYYFRFHTSNFQSSLPSCFMSRTMSVSASILLGRSSNRFIYIMEVRVFCPLLISRIPSNLLRIAPTWSVWWESLAHSVSSARCDIRIWFRLMKTRCGSSVMTSLLIIADRILIGSEII